MKPGYDEEGYKNIINLLRQLPKVDAPPNFESDLMRRINSGNYNEKFKVRWWDKLLLPSRLVPASAFALSIVAVFYFLNFNSVERENPFLAIPKTREIVSEASVYGPFKINKEGLNFLHIRLNEAEKAKINRLKEQIKAYFNEKQ
jgi:hypothetical protein